MREEQLPQQHEQKGELPSDGITQPVPDYPILGKDKPGASNQDNSKKDENPSVQIGMRTIRNTEEELELFERESLKISKEMLKISRFTYRVAIFAFLAAAAAAIFIGIQMKIMSDQTQILASQSESASAGGLMDGMNTRRQLDIGERQADALQDQVTATAQATQESVSAIRRQMRQDQRAWMEVSFTKPAHPTEIGIGVPLAYPLRIRDTGKTAAIHVKAYLQLEIVPRYHCPKMLYSRFNTNAGLLYPDMPLDGDAMTYDLSPGNSPVQPVPLNKQEFLCLRDAKCFVIFFADVRYLDIFGVKHWTHFCEFDPVRIKGGVTAKKCTDYNGADNN
jgi:hypothetical protein